MSTHQNPTAAAAAGTGPAAGGGSGLLLALRIFATVHVVAILLQGMSAGGMLDGDSGMADLHGTGAGLVHGAGLLQVIVAVLWWRPGRGAGWPALASLVLLVGGGLQSAMGGNGNVTVHVPLGMGLLTLAVVVAGWAWTARAARRRART